MQCLQLHPISLTPTSPSSDKNNTARMQPQVKVANPARSIVPRTATAAISRGACWICELIGTRSPGTRELLIVREAIGVKSQVNTRCIPCSNCAQRQRHAASEQIDSNDIRQAASTSSQTQHQATSEQREKACRCPFTVSCARGRSSQRPSTLIVRKSEKPTRATIGQGQVTNAKGSTRERERQRTAECGCR
jgi:hypothetical protein